MTGSEDEYMAKSESDLMSVARRPPTAELRQVAALVDSAHRHASEGAAAARTPALPDAETGRRLREQLKRLAAMGVLAAHVGMLGAEAWDVDQLRAVPGVVVVFPAWLTVTEQVRTAARVRRLLQFIGSRHGPGADFAAMATATVVQCATPGWR
jgi:hypothetical protein